MSHILDLMSGAVTLRPDRISIEKYVVESSYITKYLARVVKDKALAVYHVLFYLTYFESGKGQIIIPWVQVGSYIRSDQGNIIEDSSTIKRRLTDLLQNKCISVKPQRGGANEITVHLPSEIQACKILIESEQQNATPPEEIDNRDYYTDNERRLEILGRDQRKCAYCLLEVSEDTYVLDHLVPTSKGGTNNKQNLVTSCPACNGRKGNEDSIQFLLKNYREQLLQQNEFLAQKAYLEKLLSKNVEYNG